MKGKLVCLIGLTAIGIIGAIVSRRQTLALEQEQVRMDAKLEELRRQEEDLLKQLDMYHQKTEEEIQTTKELISIIRELESFDPTKIDIQIDPE